MESGRLTYKRKFRRILQFFLGENRVQPGFVRPSVLFFLIIRYQGSKVRVYKDECVSAKKTMRSTKRNAYSRHFDGDYRIITMVHGENTENMSANRYTEKCELDGHVRRDEWCKQSTDVHCKDTIPKIRNIFPEMEMRGHSPNFYIHVSVCDLQNIFPRAVCIFCCRKIAGPIVEIYKSLTNK